MTKKIAWCIVTDNENDLISLRRFAERQKWLKSSYPVLALIGENIPNDKLELFNDCDNLKWRYVPNIALHTEGRYKSTIMKISGLLQDDYDFLLFIETDIFIKNNIDFIYNPYLDISFFSKTNFLFFRDTKAWTRHKHIQGLSFIMKPSKVLYYDIINYMDDTDSYHSQVVDELFLTKFLINKQLTLNDISTPIAINSLKLLFSNIVHFPGPYKPWNYYNDFWLDLYFNKDYFEFNMFLDNPSNWNDITLLAVSLKLIYILSSFRPGNGQEIFKEQFSELSNQLLNML